MNPTSPSMRPTVSQNLCFVGQAANGREDKENRPNRRLTQIDFRGLPWLHLLGLVCVHPCLSRHSEAAADSSAVDPFFVCIRSLSRRSLRRRIHSQLSWRPGSCEFADTSNPLGGCDSDLAHYSHTPILQHSAWPDSRTTTRTRTKRLVSLAD
jgi:hypothetical protein